MGPVCDRSRTAFDAVEQTAHPELVAELRSLVEHRLQPAAVGRLASRRERGRMLEEDTGANRPRPEKLAAGEGGRKVAVGLLPASQERGELAEPECDGPERLLRVRDGVVVVVGKQQLVELEPALRVADENGRLGEHTEVKDPQPVAREVREATRCVALELAACHLLVAELGCRKRIAPARDPRKPSIVILDLGPELVQPALRPPDREHLRVAEDVRRVLAPA